MDLTNSSYLIPFKCNESFDPLPEILKYVVCVAYLIPGAILHLLILKCILGTGNGTIQGQLVFPNLCDRLDCVSNYLSPCFQSVTIILLDVSFGRLFLFVTPLCPIVGPFFWSPSVILKAFYYLTNHARFAKSVAQTFMVLNRMSCVLMPMSYAQLWKRFTRVSVLLIVLLPLLGTWNILISRMKPFSSFGGFGVGYNRAVEWASLSMFQLIYVSIALVFTVICTSITLFKLIVLPDRIKSVERSLCFTSIFISVTFLLVAATQVHYAIFSQVVRVSWIYIAQFIAFDTLTVGSAVIMFLTNSQLRNAILPRKFQCGRGKIADDRVFQVSISHSNMSQS